ncbi:MAG: tetratricopeptide repeat protein, partial [Steroidobacteraceae bacterium]
TVLMRAGNRERALAVLDDAADGGAGRSVIDAAIEKAQLLSMFGEGRDAIKLLDETLARFPGHPLLRYERATALERSGRSAESLRGFEVILKECPQDSLVQNALGYTLADHNQQLGRAETLIRQALSASPDSAAILDSLAWVRYRRRDATRALPLLERAWRLANDAEIAAHWGEVLWSVGRHDDASAVWSRALVFAPQSTALQAVIARFTPAARKKADPAAPAARNP